MEEHEKKRTPTYDLWRLGWLLNPLTVFRRQEDDSISSSEPIVLPREVKNNASAAAKMITANAEIMRIITSLGWEELNRFLGVVAEMRDDCLAIAEKRKKRHYDEHLRLLNALLEWEPKGGLWEIADDESGSFRVVRGPIAKYIEDKWGVLCEIHADTLRRTGFLMEETTPRPGYKLSQSQRRTLRILVRLFAAGANDYPGMTHKVLSWPITRYIPKPPSDEWPDLTLPKMSREQPYGWQTVFAGPLRTRETLTYSRLRAHPKAGWNQEIAHQRFHGLALEAGRIVGQALFGLRIREEGFPDDMKYVSLWLQTVHLVRGLYQARSDSWRELFDDDSDFWEEGWRKGLYGFSHSDDVFLDSTLVCNALLYGDFAADGEGAPSTQRALARRAEVAYSQWEYAITKVGEDATDKECYAYLKEHGYPGEEESVLPDFETWKRYVGLARQHHGTQKNQPRAGRATRSVVRRDQI